MQIRNYKPEYYESIKALYMQSDLYGGQFDEARDSQTILNAVTQSDPQSILVCVAEGHIVGTVSLIENGRVAWLFRFAVMDTPNKIEIEKSLYEAARDILHGRGHTQILVYTPVGHAGLNERYKNLGMIQGGDYTCFWAG